MTITDQPVATPLAAQIDTMVSAGLVALKEYANFTQEQIDFIVKKASVAALSKHAELAVHAVAETAVRVREAVAAVRTLAT